MNPVLSLGGAGQCWQAFETVEAQGQRAGFVGGGRLVDEQRLQTERVKERGDAIDKIAERYLFHVENPLHVRARARRARRTSSGGRYRGRRKRRCGYLMRQIVGVAAESLR